MEISALKQQQRIKRKNHNPRSSRPLQITVDKQGKALCPFHDDKSPACSSAKKRISAPALAPNAMQAPWILLGLPRRN
jgi:hypothetical protein